MAGYQFIHFENYARKCRSDKKNRTVKEVLDEAFRVPGNMPHVAAVLPPRVVYGMSEDELRATHDAVELATQTQKNGKARKIRNTQNTLATAVLSYPVPCSDVRGNAEERAKYNEWVKRSIKFMKSIWGEDFKCAVQHTDETFPHIHCFAIAPDFDASKLHPGLKAANEAALKGVKGKGLGAAACAGLRHVQDDYQDNVGKFFGQARIGPKRQRKTRREWRDEQYKNDLDAAKYKDLQALKDAAALDFKDSNPIAKLAAVRVAVKNEEVRKASRMAVNRALGPYRKDLDKAEKNAKQQAVRADIAERGRRKMAVEHGKMQDTVLSLQEDARLYEYALSEAVEGLYMNASETQRPEAYKALSGACETVVSVNQQKPASLKNLAVRVWDICRSVKSKTPAMFQKFFGWTGQTDNSISQEKTRIQPHIPSIH